MKHPARTTVCQCAWATARRSGPGRTTVAGNATLAFVGTAGPLGESSVNVCLRHAGQRFSAVGSTRVPHTGQVTRPGAMSSSVLQPILARIAHPASRRTPGISCERPIRSTLVSFIPLFDGMVPTPTRSDSLRRRRTRPWELAIRRQASGHWHSARHRHAP